MILSIFFFTHTHLTNSIQQQFTKYEFLIFFTMNKLQMLEIDEFI